MEYAMDTYFPHFRLYSYVLSNQQLSDQKSIDVYIDDPLPIPPLSEGLTANLEREDVSSREEQEEALSDAAASSGKGEAKIDGSAHEEAKKSEAKATDPKKEELQRNLPKLRQATEHIINNKVQEFKNGVQAKINEREKMLDKMVEEMQGSNNKH